MIKLAKSVVVSFGALLMMTSAATAKEWRFNYESGYTAQGEDRTLNVLLATLTTEDVETINPTGVPGYRITGLTGTLDGMNIVAVNTEVDNNYDGPLGWPNAPFLTYDRGPFDYLGDFGFAYQTSDGTWWNINSDGDFSGNNASNNQLEIASDPSSPFNSQIGILEVDPISSAPEPASWALMMAGVGFVGATLRWRQKAGVAVSA